MGSTNTSKHKFTTLGFIFFAAGESRLRAGWRLTIHSLMILILSVLAGIVVFIPVGLLKIDFESPLALLADQITLFLSITMATFIARRFLDKRSLVSLGLNFNKQALADIAMGIVISLMQLGFIFGVEILLGWTKFQNFAWGTEPAATIAVDVMIWALIFLLIGWTEELLSRGYHLQTITSGLNLFWGVLISTTVFCILHTPNSGATVLSTLGIFMIGLFLALPYILTKQLWLSIGLHIGWNFFEGVVFGFPVGGLQTFRILQHTVVGPEAWTGGSFGPEAGFIVIPALILGSLFVFAYTLHRKTDLN